MVKLLLPLALLCLVLAPAARADNRPRVVVETLDREVVGLLEPFNSSEGILQLTQDSFEMIPLSRALGIRFESRRPATRTEPAESVTLVGGVSFAAEEHSLRDDEVSFRLAGEAFAVVPVNELARWAFTPTARDRLLEGSGADEASDLLLVKPRSGEGLTPVEGIVQGIDAEGIDFLLSADSGGELVRAPWRRIAGLRFYRSAEEAPAPFAVVLNDGGRLAARSVIVDGSRVRWSSPAGGRGEAPLASVSRIDLAADRATPVSALPLLAETWRPYGGIASGKTGHTLDKALDGKPIRLRRRDPRAPAAWPDIALVRDYSRGIALASEGELRFALPRGARRIKGVVGLDPAVSEAGDCQVRVLCDERVVWESRLTRETPPAMLAIDPEGAETLTLRVDYGANLDAGDRIHFANLRVIQ